MLDKAETIKNNKDGINLIIKQLEKIRDSEELEDYVIGIETKYFFEENHTKGAFIKRNKIGDKLIITIKRGHLYNIKKTFLGTEITEED